MDEDFEQLKKLFDETAEEADDAQIHGLARHAVMTADGRKATWFGWFALAGAAALALFIGLGLVGQGVEEPTGGPVTAVLQPQGLDEDFEDLNDDELEELVVYLDLGMGDDDFSDVDVLHGTLDEDFDLQWIED
jgi:hypothetical protein